MYSSPLVFVACTDIDIETHICTYEKVNIFLQQVTTIFNAAKYTHFCPYSTNLTISAVGQNMQRRAMNQC